MTRTVSIWTDGKLPSAIGEDFQHLAGLRHIGEAELPLLNVTQLVENVAKRLGLPPKPTVESGHTMALVSTPTTRLGEVPAFTVTHDTSHQTGKEIRGFEVAPDAYRQIKNLLPSHRLDTAKYKGRLMARPTKRLGAA